MVFCKYTHISIRISILKEFKIARFIHKIENILNLNTYFYESDETGFFLYDYFYNLI